MTGPDLSVTQRAAVAHPLADALVTAGAGSGKTRVLTERFVHLARRERVPLRRLAALTFTEKAASQMRERIAGLFQDLGDESARADVEFAPISTIHAYCAQLLRQHAVEARLDPAFQVLDAVESSLLLQDAAALAERHLAGTRPEALDALPLLAGGGRAPLLSLLLRVRGCGREASELTWHRTGADPARALPEARACALAFAAQQAHVPEAEAAPFAAVLAQVAEALDAAEATDDEFAPFLCAQARGAVAACKHSRKRDFTTARKELEVALEALAGTLLDAWGERTLLPLVHAALGAYEDAYRDLKRARSALDFTDLELEARALLRRAASIGRPLDLAPRALLVDEYQDTNPLQAEILDLLRRHAPQFAVGDPKQSIYRFRRADVKVILRERERVGVAGSHAMNTSYRACPPLVDGINALNRRLFEGGQAGVDYEPLEAGATFRTPASPPLEFALIDAGAGALAPAARALEAAWIARRIADLVKEGATRLAQPREGPAGEPVPLRYGDIAVLFRARSNLAIYEAALDACRVPYLTQKGSGFFQADEIADLVYVLRVVHNPADVFALAAVATGPALAADDDALLRWFAPGESTPWERMQEEARLGGVWAGAVATLSALRLEAAVGSLARCVERALLELGLLEVALLHPAGDRKAANLRKAVELARRMERGGRRGLGDLLRHLETLRVHEVAEAEAAVGGETEDVVRLTTVHGAKGLEYPVVFLADVGRRLPSSTPLFRYDGERGVTARIRDPLEGVGRVPAGYAELAAAETIEEREEERRLLYVAMTRAEERLVLSGWCKGVNKGDGRPKELAGWGRDLWRVLDQPVEPGTREIALDGAPLTVHVIPADTVLAPPPAVVGQPARVTEDDRAEARARLCAAAGSVAPMGDTRYVVSVSELLAFADSPQRYYAECVLRAPVGGAACPLRSEPDDPASEAGEPDRGARAERIAAFDEPAEVRDGLDRAALGRVTHAVIEGLASADEAVPDALLERVLFAEFPEGVPTGMREAARTMAERFLDSSLGRRTRAALAAGADVRRELSLHARIRFPGGEPVAGLDSLLVKGSIDLWLPTPEGIWIIDHKTNAPGSRAPSPEALGARYAWQLRLYALAAERVLGADVAGACLLLLDPGWGPQAVVVPVEVGGADLEETRRLCRALAIAEHEGRYPPDWRSLLEQTPAPG